MKIEMPHAYIVAAKRSPFVKARPEKDKAFHDEHPADLAIHVAKKAFYEAAKGSTLKAENIDDVILGLVEKVGKQSFDPARTIAIKAFGNSVPGKTVDRQCGSSLEALNDATRAIQCGDADVVVVIGLEDMKTIPMGSSMLPPPISVSNMWKVFKKGPKAIFDSFPSWYKFNDMVTSGELVANKYGISREDADKYAASSQNKAHEANEKGYFKSEIIPIPVSSGAVLFEDDGIRKSSVDVLSKLPVVSKNGKIVTAGNSSQKTAGTAAIVLVSDKAVEKYGLKPLGEVVAQTVVAADPEIQLDAPILAIPKVLEKAGLKKEDMDRIEINEAFATVPLACIKQLGLDENKVNAQGGAIALGHPLGASGARLIVTLVHQLQRENLNYGLATLCEGGGQANATIIKRV